MTRSETTSLDPVDDAETPAPTGHAARLTPGGQAVFDVPNGPLLDAFLGAADPPAATGSDEVLDELQEPRDDDEDALPVAEREVALPTEPTLAGAARRLDWIAIVRAVAERCSTERGRRIALAHPLFDDPSIIVRRMSEVAEVRDLIAESDRPPVARVADVATALVRARRGAILAARPLSRIARALTACNELRRFFRTRQDDAPLCWQVATPMVPLERLAATLESVFDPDGRLRDDASPDLGRLRQRVRSLNDKLRTEIDRRARGPELERQLQDSYYTIREGRYVLPVRVQSRGRVDGIVHATSSSGQTVFVEPADLVEANNQLRLADFDVQDEEQRILRRLSDQVARVSEEIIRSVERLYYFDVLVATADLAVALGLEVPNLGAECVSLRRARHPLLLLRAHEQGRQGLEPDPVVPNTIALESGQRGLVISGANAGGKTVSLKTLGLFALMARAGLPVSAEAESDLPLYRTIATDIGDEQSIANDMSTFSAHVLNLVRMLPEVDADSLILLDEPFAGTDPGHAGALSIALLEWLEQRGATAVVTTHLDEVKAFALEQPWIQSASVDFDVERMAPTYRLRLGIPGGSSALRIARRLGLDDALVERAQALRAGAAAADLDVVVDRLERTRGDLDEKLRHTERLERELEAERQRLVKAKEKARRGELRVLEADSAKLRQALRAARAGVDEVEASLKASRKTSPDERKRAAKDARETLRTLEQAARDAEKVAQDAREPDRARVDAAQLEAGQEVYSRQYRTRATVVDVDRRGVTLQAGPLKVTVPADDLYSVETVSTRPKRSSRRRRRRKRSARGRSGRQPTNGARKATRPSGAASVRPTVPQTDENTLDLRGLRSDEAVERVDLFLDGLLRKDLPNAFVIHGHGTGALKRAVRQYASSSPVVVASRPGERHEGGDGVTVVWIGDD